MAFTFELYQIDLTNNQFTRLDEIITFRPFSYTRVRNGIGKMSFTLNVYDPKASPGTIIRDRVQVLIKEDGVPRWLGKIRKIKGDAEDQTGTVSIECLEYISHLQSRFSGALETRTGAANAIVTDLVSEVQARTNGQLFIQPGSVETLDAIQDTFEYKSIFDIMQDQSDNIVGYDFWIEPHLDSDSMLDYALLNIDSSRGSVRDDLPTLSLQDNVLSIEFATQNEILNTVTALGAGTGITVLTAPYSDTSSQVGFTRKEAIRKFSDQNNSANLLEKAISFIEVYKAERFDIDITLNPTANIQEGDFDLGDILKINLVIPNTFINFVGYGKVEEIRVDVNEQGVKKISPKLRYYSQTDGE